MSRMIRALSALTLYAMTGMVSLSQAALVGRSLDEDPTTAEAYYDTVLSITWLRDANAGPGAVVLPTALAWVTTLSFSGSWGTATEWRLPIVRDPGTANDPLLDTRSFVGTDRGVNVRTATVSPPEVMPPTTTVYSELAYMFYENLGDLANRDRLGNNRSGTSGVDWGLTNVGPFTNLQNDIYWSETEFSGNGNLAWNFLFVDGSQEHNTKTAIAGFAWAVHPGSVGAAVVPLPATVWLMLTGMAGIAGLARRPGHSRLGHVSG